ncbi:hypothetical protein NITHO_3580003 [Nitrolancea hollandica Lb]|uniref:Uncharacterized protein n=1 Tax=Nitrolancea hollandica Lb TaxID=1129897 RepID=I4EIN5_9BACT|nr:hypothetical protein NITHO_3580003 [Nitrolancea hollandica Lb]
MLKFLTGHHECSFPNSMMVFEFRNRRVYTLSSLTSSLSDNTLSLVLQFSSVQWVLRKSSATI